MDRILKFLDFLNESNISDTRKIQSPAFSIRDKKPGDIIEINGEKCEIVEFKSWIKNKEALCISFVGKIDGKLVDVFYDDGVDGYVTGDMKKSLTESKINISEELDSEISEVIKNLLKNDCCYQVDPGYIEIETPFELNPDARNREWVKKVGMVFYPELLSYSENGKDVMTPWIACRIELENISDEKLIGDLLKWLVELLKKSGYKPFMDEDAKWNHWKADNSHKDWKEYICYINPSYPEGYWENHAIE